jgi:hypothetical protein
MEISRNIPIAIIVLGSLGNMPDSLKIKKKEAITIAIRLLIIVR